MGWICVGKCIIQACTQMNSINAPTPVSLCLNVSGEYAQTRQQGLPNQQTTMVYTKNSIADTPRYDRSPMGDGYN